MIIVIHQAGVGGVSDSEPGAKNGFLGVLALRIYVCTLPPITDFLPFQNDSTIRSWIDRYLWSIVLAVSASFLHNQEHFSPEHLVTYFLTKCYIRCMIRSPKKGNSGHGTFLQEVTLWNDHDEV